MENSKKSFDQLNYENPLVGVFLRVLASEIFNNKGKFRAKDITTNLLQFVRNELGLKPITGGAPQQFINILRGKNWIKNDNEKGFSKFILPSQDEWKSETSWRILYAPMHGATRKLSELPILGLITTQEEHCIFNVSLRNPALDTIKVFIGNKVIPKEKKSEIMKRRGLYILGLENDKIYIGKTTEFGVRAHSHLKSKKIKWWIFFSPENINITKDSLDAAEAIMISYWNEVSLIHNRNRGSDQKPDFIYLQQATLFVQSCSATVIWLAREIKIQNSLDTNILKGFENTQNLISFKKKSLEKNYLEPENIWNKKKEESKNVSKVV